MVLIAYDGSADSNAAIESAGQMLPGAAVTILTVWEPFLEVMAHTGSGLGLTPGMVDFAEIDKISEQNASERAARGVELAKGAGLDAKPQVRAQRTTVADAILAEASALDAEAIVLGTRGLTGIKSMLLGSVSHAVTQHADRPVIVVPSPEIAGERAAQRR